jgi:hypothetical protein
MTSLSEWPSVVSDDAETNDAAVDTDHRDTVEVFAMDMPPQLQRDRGTSPLRAKSMQVVSRALAGTQRPGTSPAAPIPPLRLAALQQQQRLSVSPHSPTLPALPASARAPRTASAAALARDDDADSLVVSTRFTPSFRTRSRQDAGTARERRPSVSPVRHAATAPLLPRTALPLRPLMTELQQRLRKTQAERMEQVRGRRGKGAVPLMARLSLG